MEKKIKSSILFKNDFLTLKKDDVLVNDVIKTNRVFVEHNGGACALPITTDGLFILTKQYRYPIGKYSIEIPAGKKDGLESGITCITRELNEETGYRAKIIDKIFDTHNCVGYSSEMIEVFIARDCFIDDNPLPSDEDEFIEVLLLTEEEFCNLIENNDITDAKTIMAFQWYLLHK